MCVASRGRTASLIRGGDSGRASHEGARAPQWRASERRRLRAVGAACRRRDLGMGKLVTR
jgi:hypothetical protein